MKYIRIGIGPIEGPGITVVARHYSLHAQKLMMMEPTWATIVHVVWNGRDHIQSTARVTEGLLLSGKDGKEGKSGKAAHVALLTFWR